MAGIRQDFRFALRILRGAPAFAGVAALTLGLAIGANAAMVGLFDALLVRPPAGVREPGEVVRVVAEVAALPGRPPELVSSLSYPQFEALRTRAGGFGGVAAFATTPLSVGEGETARNEPVILASGGYFGVLGVRAGLGRLLQPEDDREGAPNPVAVLSWQYWRRAHGGDPGVLGRTVRVGEQSLTIVGVAPRRFVGTELASPALWVPLSLAGSLGYDAAMIRSPFVSWLSVVGRLREGMGPEQARATAQSALLVAEEERATAVPPRLGGGGTPGGARIEVRMRAGGPDGPPPPAPPPPRVQLPRIGGIGIQEGPSGAEGGPPVQLWYLAVTGAVLLIACANVANLLLARGAYRAHELAVRLSIGATPARIGRQLVTESVVLALLGGAVGFGVAMVIWRLLPRLIEMPPLPSLLDARALLVTLALTAATVLLFGVAPLVALRRPDIRGLLGQGAPSIARKTRGKSALVVVQLAVSVVLLVGAGLFIRSFERVRTLDLGFDRERLAVATAETRGAGWTPGRSAAFWEAAAERVARLPGVRGVALGASPPYLMQINTPFLAPGEDFDPERVEPAQVDYVSPTFFSTLGIPIEEGRAFTAGDREGAARVAVVSRGFARVHFQGASPVGRCLRTPRDPACIEVVGVAGDARFGEVTGEAPDFVYLPLAQVPARPLGIPLAAGVLHVRADGDPARLAPEIRRELRALEPVPVEVRSIEELVAPQLTPWRAAAVLLTLFGAIGLLLAAVGLYGVVAFLVARRTREIGIRVALGATRRDVLETVLGDAGRLVAMGAGAGLVLAVGATRVFRASLYGVSPLDPLVYLGTLVLLVVVALLAAVSPARRAVRVDPMVALRAE